MKKLKAKQIDTDLELQTEKPKEEKERSKQDNYFPIDADLPSQMLFYPESVTKISISPFKIKDTFQVHYASATDNPRVLVDAINTHFLEDVNCYGLTTKDFYYVLFWLRENSYFKHKITKEFFCTNDEHREKVANGELEIETLMWDDIIALPKVEVSFLDKEIIEKFNYIKETYNIECTPEMLHSRIQYDEYVKENVPVNEKGDFDFTQCTPEVLNVLFIANKALYLSEKHGISLEERVNFLVESDLPPDLFFEIEEFAKLAEDCGVSEQVQSTCKECGHSTAIDLAVDARSFFSRL